jgi:RNAse H-fold protein YqgF
MRYLGLDLGTKTLGIAISDLTHTIATPYKLINMNEKDYDSLLKPIKYIVSEEHIKKIILGLPKNMNNSLTERANETIQFKSKLEKVVDCEIVLQDERLSTVSAHNYMLEADMSRKKERKK